MSTDVIRVLSPTAILGYGFPVASFEDGLSRNPDVIAVDAGSTDPGPYYLGAGVSFTDRQAVKRDLEYLLIAGRSRKIPVLIGSAGGAGARPHLDWCVDIVKEIFEEQKLSGRLAIIPSDISAEVVLEALEEQRIERVPSGPELFSEAVEASTFIVAQIGEEPIMAALEKGADVVICGRSGPDRTSALGVPSGLCLG